MINSFSHENQLSFRETFQIDWVLKKKISTLMQNKYFSKTNILSKSNLFFLDEFAKIHNLMDFNQDMVKMIFDFLYPNILEITNFGHDYYHTLEDDESSTSLMLSSLNNNLTPPQKKVCLKIPEHINVLIFNPYNDPYFSDNFIPNHILDLKFNAHRKNNFTNFLPVNLIRLDISIEISLPSNFFENTPHLVELTIRGIYTCCSRGLKLPENLKILKMQTGGFISDFIIPDGLEELYLLYPFKQNLDYVDFPANLKILYIDCDSNFDYKKFVRYTNLELLVIQGKQSNVYYEKLIEYFQIHLPLLNIEVIFRDTSFFKYYFNKNNISLFYELNKKYPKGIEFGKSF